MKKILFALMCMFALTFCACNTNTTEPEMMDTAIIADDTTMDATMDTTMDVIVDSVAIDTNLLFNE